MLERTKVAGTTDAPPLPTRGISEPKRLTVPRQPVAVGLAGFALLIPLLGLAGLWSVLALLCLAGLIGTSIAPGPGESTARLMLVHWLCAALPFVLLGATGVGMAAHFLGLPIWQTRTSALLAWTLLTIALLAMSWRRPSAVALAQDWSEVITFCSTLVVCASVIVVQPFEQWSRLVGRGTDFSRHVAMVGSLMSDGALGYSANAYPRSAHAALAAVQSAAGDTSVSGAWQATEGLLLLMLALMAAASALLAIKVMRVLGGPRWLATFAAPALVASLVLTGPWVADMLPGGFLTSYEAGLIIAAAALLFVDGAPRVSTTATIGLIGMTVLMAHTWILLVPVLALPTLRLVWTGCRSRSSRLAILLSAELALLLATPVVISSVRLLGLDAISLPGGTTLPGVGALWLAILLTAAGGILALSRGGAGGPTRSLSLAFAGLFVVVGFLLAMSDGTPEGSYWVIKAAWTPLALFLALGVPVVLIGLWRARGGRRAVLAAAAISAVVLTQPGSLAESGRIILGDRADAALAPLTIPVLEQLGPPGQADSQHIVVWGLNPYLEADADSIDWGGRSDLVALGALLAAGYQVSDVSHQHALADHDPIGVCAYLTEHPDALRITGPYPQGPIQWLLDAGCPDSVVRPGHWMSIEIDPAWFTGTEVEDRPYGSDYATWADSKPIVEAGIRAREDQALGAE